MELVKLILFLNMDTKELCENSSQKKKERKEKLCKMGIFTNFILISYEIFKFKCSNLVPTFPVSEIK